MFKLFLLSLLVLILSSMGPKVRTVCVEWDASYTGPPDYRPEPDGYDLCRMTDDINLPITCENVGKVLNVCRKENGIRRYWFVKAWRLDHFGYRLESGPSNILDVKPWT